MKKTALSLALAATALLATSVANAYDSTGWFIEGRIGSSSIDEDQFDDDTTALQFNTGYRWGGWGIEGGYVNFDDYDDEAEDLELQAGIDGWMLGVNGRTNFSDSPWYISGRLGAFFWDAEADRLLFVGNQPAIATVDTDGTDIYAGVGFGYDFSEQFSMGIAYDYFGAEGDDDDITLDSNVFSLTGEFRF